MSTGDFLSITIEGLDETVAKLNLTANEMPMELQDGVYQAAFPMYYALTDYPAEVPGSSYARTYNYRDQISIVPEMNGSEAGVEIDQGAEYSIYLRGTTDGSYSGAWMHLGRWRTLKDIIDTFTPVFIFKLQQAIDDFLSRLWS